MHTEHLFPQHGSRKAFFWAFRSLRRQGPLLQTLAAHRRRKQLIPRPPAFLHLLFHCFQAALALAHFHDDGGLLDGQCLRGASHFVLQFGKRCRALALRGKPQAPLRVDAVFLVTAASEARAVGAVKEAEATSVCLQGSERLRHLLHCTKAGGELAQNASFQPRVADLLRLCQGLFQERRCRRVTRELNQGHRQAQERFADGPRVPENSDGHLELPLVPARSFVVSAPRTLEQASALKDAQDKVSQLVFS